MLDTTVTRSVTGVAGAGWTRDVTATATVLDAMHVTVAVKLAQPKI